MRSRLILCCYAACLLGTPAFAAKIIPEPGEVTVHEWGTFTSVAGVNGGGVPWLPLAGPSDLPCFVARLGDRNIKFASGFVRMETPVLYFYAPQPATLSVQVDFPSGLITEWYPRASVVRPEQGTPVQWQAAGKGHIEWNRVQVRPGDKPALPVEKAASHYYAARETDAAALQVGNQSERLIFYRGLGNFAVPLSAVFNDGKLEVRGGQPLPLVIVFENRDGKAGYRIVKDVTEMATIAMPELTGDVGQLREAMETALVGQGLFAKEAHAMLETWKDSWFEEGTRVFYIVPASTVNTELPLRIDPSPKELTRVFVGRVEMLSPWMEQRIETALRAGDVTALAKYGRFLQPFEAHIARRAGRAFAAPSHEFLRQAYAKIQQEFNGPACVP